MFSIPWWTFGVLDERSKEDRTVLVRHQVTIWPVMEEDGENLDRPDEEGRDEWRSWRFAFADAQWALAQLQINAEAEYEWFMKDVSMGENGVTKLDSRMRSL